MKQFSKLADTSSNNVVFILVGEIVIGLALFVFCWMFQMKKNNLLAIESTL